MAAVQTVSRLMNIQGNYSRWALEKKLPKRMFINPTILANASIDQANSTAGPGLLTAAAPNITFPILKLPNEIIQNVYKILGPVDQVAFAMTCKVLGSIAAGVDFNITFVDNVRYEKYAPEDYEDNPDGIYAARYNGSAFYGVLHSQNMHLFDQKMFLLTSFRKHYGFLEGLFVDLPALMVSLRPQMDRKLRLCGHCMTYRPTAKGFWNAKWTIVRREIGDFGPTGWGRKSFSTTEIGGRWEDIKNDTRMERCPFCRYGDCELTTASCAGCRMQAELYDLVGKGSL